MTPPERPPSIPPKNLPTSSGRTSSPPSSGIPLDSDDGFMLRATEIAKKGHPSPNPHVGAVVVKDGVIVGSAHHERAGQEHAEARALAEAGDRARGAVLYVTLEPCNHTGKTPPCTDAIIAAGVRRVVVGARDPNPNVTGGGVERLAAAGVEVSLELGEGARAAADAVARPWLRWVTTGRPYVTLKLALSLDGRIATRTGASRWVTGKLARAKVHALRAKHDAIAVGVGTVLADDPRLTVRDTVGPNPTRVVFDTNLRIALDGALVKTANETPTWIVTAADLASAPALHLLAQGVRLIQSPVGAEGRLDLTAALAALADAGIVSLMVEGGAELAGSLLATELADELHAFIAPVLFGPRGRPGAVDWGGPASPELAPRLERPIWELCGEDAYIHGPFRYPDRS
jgi:diaminohydroxyphosphoribosylaminopyrimidine deaminase / 5-amino-6-(5-phosphoribosylamino)uracil reductase